MITRNCCYAVMFLLPFLVQAQQTIEQNDEVTYNRWSLEFNAGQSKPVTPFKDGYASSEPGTLFYVNLNHFDFGVRYMFNNYWGIKADVAIDNLENGEYSLPFESRQIRFGAQGVFNLGRVFRFENFTSRLGLLAHAGGQISQFTPLSGVNKDQPEKNFGLLFGITPQLRISNRIVLNADFTIINNQSQHYNWDGSGIATKDNLSALMYNTSVGVMLYLGKQEKHADWFTEEDKLANLLTKDEAAHKRIDEIETLMNDTDKDGVPDYLDRENNTPNGVAVDTRGRFIDVNNNGVPDEMEKRKKQFIKDEDGNFISNDYVSIDKPNDSTSSHFSMPKDPIKDLVEEGYLNLFFDINKDVPNAGSTNNLFALIKFLNDYPSAKILLQGYTDSTGTEENNLDLSRRRVQNVFDALVASGIREDRLKIEANGVDNALKSNANSSLARRVSITTIN